MTSPGTRTGLNADTLERLLDLTRSLAGPYDLAELLVEVVNAALAVLSAERGSVFLFDPKTDELYTTVATGIDGIRFPATRGIAGSCAGQRQVVRVDDCYADPRFNQAVDQQSGYRTRCVLAVPLIGYDDALIGVLQLLNRIDGVFTADDEGIATALAAQCAVAIQTVRINADKIEKERLAREMSIARDVQRRVLPTRMPDVPGYDIAGWNRPADATGGDIYDAIPLDDHRLLVFLADASGHGIGPALTVTQVRSMLRVGIRLGTDLRTAISTINEQLLLDLADNRFVTAFLGVLDHRAHTLTYQSCGQGPLLVYRGHTRQCELRDATMPPMGMMPYPVQHEPLELSLAPGDIFALLSDGVLEYPNTQDEPFGPAGVEGVIREHPGATAIALIEAVVGAVEGFGAGVVQPDDMTMLLIRRR
jgi:phosphoserine phosphatase RsbU/P